MGASFNKTFSFWLTVFLSLTSFEVFAQIDSAGILDDVLNAYAGQAAGWANIILNSAQWIFWLLVTVSMVVTFGFLALKKADIAEFFAELIRFILFVGFFQWLLINGPQFATDIINSLRQIGSNASGLPNALSPSGIVDIGFDIIARIFRVSTIWSPVDSTVGILLGVVIVVVLALIGINMLLLLISAWFLAFAGVFFLGFGGSKWTSDIAINYYKSVLGLAAEIMAMILLVGIGQNIITQYENNMSAGIELIELVIILVVSLVLLLLTNKVPSLLSGIINGTSVGGNGVGNFGAGAAVGAMATMAAAAGAAASALSSVAASTAGGGSAISAAYQSAQNAISGGNNSGSMSLADTGTGQDFQGSNSAGESSLSTAMGGGSDQGDSFSQSSAMDSSSSGVDGSSGESGNDGSSGTDGVSGFSETSPDSGSVDSSQETSTQASSSVSDSGASPENSSGDSNDSAESGESSDGQKSGMAKAAAIAGHMAKSLASGAASHMKNKAGEKLDDFKEKVSQTAGGKIASEIKNPGMAAQQRADSKTVAQAESAAAAKELSQKAAEARGEFQPPTSDEISDFVNKE